MTDEQQTPPTRAPRRRKRGAAKPATAKPAATTAPTPHANDAPTAARAAAPADGAAPADAAPAFVSIPIHVRWHDLDAFNHVNNASFLTLLEEARLQWLRGVPGEWFGEHAMPVMAAIELKYLKPITWPAEIDVELGCVKLGNTSVTLRNRVVERSDRTCIYADGTLVLVWVDPVTGKAVPLPEPIRSACRG
jgi:acyl-CoA thioester hydrolase